MKKVLIGIIAIIMALLAIGLFCYPMVANIFNAMMSDAAVMQYLDASASLSQENYDKKMKLANEYNASLVGNVYVGDPFSSGIASDSKVKELLELDDNETVAAIEIPILNLSLPVYYGTSQDILEKGIGQLENSSLPVGGTGTHSVLTGHTGYGGLKLFTDLDQLKQGDVFYINSLGDKKAYVVDNIAKVLPEETDLLQIDPEKDYVTLVTCTPYGINTHRLLVRGKRIPTKEATEIMKTAEISDSTWDQEYQQAIILGVAIMVIIIIAFVLVRIILFVCRKRKKDEKQNT